MPEGGPHNCATCNPLEKVQESYVFDLYDISTSSLAKQMKGYHEFDVEKIHILFEGTCDHCKQSL